MATITTPTTIQRPLITWTRREKPNSTSESSNYNNNERFFISTNQQLLSVKAINAAFDSPFVYWAKALDESLLQAALDGSFNLGVYKYVSSRPSSSSSITDRLTVQEEEEDRKEVESLQPSEIQQIGLARLITDNVTFVYLTDVYILPEYQNRGLGSWLIQCVSEAWSPKYMPILRRVMLYTSIQVKWYEKLLGLRVVGSETINGVDGDTMLSIMTGRGTKESNIQ